MILAKDVKDSEYHSYYKTYIKLTQGDLLDHLTKELDEVLEVLNEIPVEKEHFSYDLGKWTIAQLIQHCIDTERVFQYRVFSIARGESQMLNGFDENAYAQSIPTELVHLSNLILEFTTLRQSTIALIKSTPEKAMCNLGQASGSPLSARSAGFIILGHWNHHLNILKTRYLEL